MVRRAFSSRMTAFFLSNQRLALLERWGGTRVDKDENKVDDDWKRLSLAVDREGTKPLVLPFWPSINVAVV